MPGGCAIRISCRRARVIAGARGENARGRVEVETDNLRSRSTSKSVEPQVAQFSPGAGRSFHRPHFLMAACSSGDAAQAVAKVERLSCLAGVESADVLASRCPVDVRDQRNCSRLRPDPTFGSLRDYMALFTWRRASIRQEFYPILTPVLAAPASGRRKLPCRQAWPT